MKWGSLRILIPVGLFLAFAFAHNMATKNRTPVLQLAVASQDLKAGTPLQESHLVAVRVQGEVELFRSFVPYGNRGKDLLFNRLNRDIKKGELITLADLMQPAGTAVNLRDSERGLQISLDGIDYAEGSLSIGSLIGFVVATADGKQELLEPFRVVGIGSRTEVPKGTQTDDPSARSRILTLAAEVHSDGKGEPLSLQKKIARINLAIANRRQFGTGDPSKPRERILSLYIIPESAGKKG